MPIFLATLAIRRKSQTIRFRTAAEMLETFGMHKGGKEYRRLVAAFKRIFGATIFFGTGKAGPTARVVQRSCFNFLRDAQIWFNRDSDQRILREDFESVIGLSDGFYRKVIATDLDAVKILAVAPAALDHVTYRCFVAKCAETIPIFGFLWVSGPDRLCRILPQLGSSPN